MDRLVHQKSHNPENQRRRLTIAKLDILEKITIKNKATVVLQETHKENNTNLKLPSFTLASNTKSKHHGLATFIQPIDDPKGYCPISLLCVLYEIMERLLHARLDPVIVPKLPKEQVVFCCGKSTADQVTLLTQDIEGTFQRGEKAGVVLLDLTTAYDTI